MIKLLYVKSKSSNERYFSMMLQRLKNRVNITIVESEHYAAMSSAYQDQFDVLVYHTFPHQFHFKKWNTELMKRADELFLSFKGHKLLYDSHDSGNVDAFSRFKGLNLPRIKAWPSYDFLKQHNIVQIVPGGFGSFKSEDTFESFLNELTPKKFSEWEATFPNEKPNGISYIVSYGYHDERYMDYPTFLSTGGRNKFIREDTRDVLQAYTRINTDFTRKASQSAFYQHLRETLVSVSVPGWGEGCFRQYEAPVYGCLNLIHDSVANLKFLPYIDLVDGEDFIAFNLENLHEKLDYIFDNINRVNQMRYNCKKKMHEGLDINKPVEEFYNYLSTL